MLALARAEAYPLPVTTCYFTCPSWVIEGPEDRARIHAQASRGAALFGARAVLSPLCDRFGPAETWLPAADRVADIVAGFAHEVLWSARGGHGAVHLLDAIMARPETRAPLLLAYSDGTVLHACWRAKGWGESWYASLGAVEQAGRAHDTLARLARGEGWRRERAIDPGVVALRPGVAEGPLVVGCLSVLAWLVGSAAARPLAGCVLAIEDIDITPFNADYCLTQLHHAGLLDGVVGLVGGGFTNMRPGRSGMTVTDIIAIWADRLGVPGIASLPFGHVDDGLVMPNGRAVRLEVAADGGWSFTVEPRT